MMTKTMNVREYIDYAECRQTGFGMLMFLACVYACVCVRACVCLCVCCVCVCMRACVSVCVSV